MDIAVNSTELNSENCREVEVKCSKRGEHCTTCKHNMEMSNYVKRVVEQYIHSRVGNGHTTNTTTYKEEYKKKLKK